MPDEIIATVLEPVDQEELAYQAARSWASKTASIQDDETRKKLGGYLARRGFPYSAVREAISRLQAEFELKTKELEN